MQEPYQYTNLVVINRFLKRILHHNEVWMLFTVLLHKNPNLEAISYKENILILI